MLGHRHVGNVPPLTGHPGCLVYSLTDEEAGARKGRAWLKALLPQSWGWRQSPQRAHLSPRVPLGERSSWGLGRKLSGAGGAEQLLGYSWRCCRPSQLATYPWTSGFTALGLSFLISQMGIIIVPTSQGCGEGWMS